jgi:hypothetical protein
MDDFGDSLSSSLLSRDVNQTALCRKNRSTPYSAGPWIEILSTRYRLSQFLAWISRFFVLVWLLAQSSSQPKFSLLDTGSYGF